MRFSFMRLELLSVSSLFGQVINKELPVQVYEDLMIL